MYRIIIAKSLGPEVYGLFSLAVIVASWMIILFKFGLTGGILRFVPLYLGKKSPEKAKYIHRISLTILSISGVAAGIILFLLSEVIAVKIFNNPELAHFLKTDFINITNIDGLFSENPLKNKNAKFIPKISWKNFDKMARKIQYGAGQNFVLDQNASRIIKKDKIKTIIIGNDIKNLKNLFNGKKFVGTIIS